MERLCEHCGKEIEGSPRKRFCGNVCVQGARMARLNAKRGLTPGNYKKQCAFCGKEFAGFINKEYCSRSCTAKAARKRSPEEMRAYHNAKQREYFNGPRREELLAQRRARYHASGKYDTAQMAHKNELTREAGWRLKLAVLNAYGGLLCKCCGETAPEFLTLDHVEGGGAQHRKSLRGQGTNLYRWLKKEGFPSGFQVLCMNCNFAKGKYGGCPHQKEASITPIC